MSKNENESVVLYLSYETYNQVYVDLPEGKSEGDIAKVDVEYDEVVITFTDGSVLETDGALEDLGCDQDYGSPLYIASEEGAYESGNTHNTLVELVKDLRKMIWEMTDSTGYELDEEGKEVIERANKAIDPNWEAKNEASEDKTQ